MQKNRDILLAGKPPEHKDWMIARMDLAVDPGFLTLSGVRGIARIEPSMNLGVVGLGRPLNREILPGDGC
jgi:hypothetical protein